MENILLKNERVGDVPENEFSLNYSKGVVSSKERQKTFSLSGSLLHILLLHPFAPSLETPKLVGETFQGTDIHGSRSIVVVSFSPVSQYKWLKYIRDHIRLD